MDFLIQRYLHNTTNAAHKNSGSWEDVAIVRDKPAAEAEAAAAEAIATVLPLPGEQPDRVRAIKYDAIEEFDSTPGPPQLARSEKGLRGDGT